MLLPDRLEAVLGPRVQDPDEETFLLFAHDRPEAQNLGFVDPHAPLLDLSVAGCDLAIHQSPAVLTSSRPGGTTGAVLWKITPAVAAWLARPDNFLFSRNTNDDAPLLGPDSALLELGCGISGVIGLVLTDPHKSAHKSPKVSRKRAKKSVASAAAAASSFHTHHHNTVAHYVLTDQPYVAKLIQKNLEENGRSGSLSSPLLYFRPLDWETDVVSSSLLRPDSDTHSPATSTSFDAVLACDCIYSDALIAPLVQTCADACRLRAADPNATHRSPTLCIVAQQLRDPDVLTAWLTAFHAAFHVWRIPKHFLPQELQPEADFALHVGILR